jgi:signal transduction histidine kinase
VVGEQEGLLRDKGIEVVLDLPDDLPFVLVDEDKIRQILSNLVSNAADACSSGGRIRLEGVGVDGFVEIRVVDDGEGIPPDALERIFDPFFTSKETGTGLGLYISRRLSEAQGGDLCVTSEVGSGSTFTIRLPFERRKDPISF